MEIRADFQEVEGPLKRLLVYGRAFQEFNSKKWSHYKNEEDFERIYRLSSEEQLAYEQLYGDGRDCAVTMASYMCGGFNDVRDFPTLRSYVAAFEGGWVYQTKELRAQLAEVAALGQKYGKQPWAVRAMADLFQNQIEILEAAAVVLAELKNTPLYRREGGEPEPASRTVAPASGEDDAVFLQNILAFVLLLGVGLIGFSFLPPQAAAFWLAFALAVPPLGIGFARGAHKLGGNHLVSLYKAGVGQIGVILRSVAKRIKGKPKKNS
jgi:hypothetical protein